MIIDGMLTTNGIAKRFGVGKHRVNAWKRIESFPAPAGCFEYTGKIVKYYDQKQVEQWVKGKPKLVYGSKPMPRRIASGEVTPRHVEIMRNFEWFL